MARNGVCGCGLGEEHEVALGEISDSIENGRFGAVEACGAQYVDDGWSTWVLIFSPQYHGVVHE